MRRISFATIAFIMGSLLGIACGSRTGVRASAAGGQGGTGGETLGGTGGAVATGGLAGSGAGSTGTGGAVESSQADAATDSAGEAPDADGSFGTCIAASDCVAVLNYRTGFECWFASAASKTDVSRDPCLVPWKPNPRCTTPPPPVDCPSGNQPVTHSCPATACEIPACTEGRCSVIFGSQCDKPDAGPAQSNCGSLLSAFQIALAAAQQCSPSFNPSACRAVISDACGCRVPYDDFSGICATAVTNAFNDLGNAGCPAPATCGTACVAPTKATCVPNASGTMGTCAWL
ncbi:MAG TPA: hypothetical protein VF518_03540 [Polyangia bacterium]